jgi:uncharacterized damage-inducible protein DinB
MTARGGPISLPTRKGAVLMMKVWQLAILASLVAAPAAAQNQQASADPLTAALKGQFDTVSRNVKESAEKMPEDKFSYQATKEVRTFGGFIGHVANAQFATCARAKGETNPNKENFEKVSGKAALVKAITAANEYCAGVYGGANDKWMMETVTQGQGANARQVPRAAILAGNTSHANEHYGNLVTYMRINGIVPPSTERAQAARPTQ